MKSSISSLLLAFGALAGVCQASFKNAAPFYVSSAISTGEAKYMETSTIAGMFMQSITEDICSSEEQDILYLRAYGLQNGELDTEAFQLFDNELKTVYNNVVYDEKRPNVIFGVSNLCPQPLRLESNHYSTPEEWISQIMTDNHKIHIVDLNNKEDLNEILSKLALVFSSHNLIIQGVPYYGEAFSLSKKRLGESQEELTSEEIEKTLREALQEVEEAIDERSEDFDDDGEQIDVKEEAASSGKSKVVTGGLFDAYTFFTPGIWMATIVSLFLFYLVSIALSWLGSMQISYKAFDKPVDFEKKLQ